MPEQSNLGFEAAIADVVAVNGPWTGLWSFYHLCVQSLRGSIHSLVAIVSSALVGF